MSQEAAFEVRDRLAAAQTMDLLSRKRGFSEQVGRSRLLRRTSNSVLVEAATPAVPPTDEPHGRAG